MKVSELFETAEKYAAYELDPYGSDKLVPDPIKKGEMLTLSNGDLVEFVSVSKDGKKIACFVKNKVVELDPKDVGVEIVPSDVDPKKLH